MSNQPSISSQAMPLSTPFSSFHPLHSRRLLQQQFLADLSPSAAADRRSSHTFDTHLIVILGVLVCALICALGLNAIVRCALRCSNRVAFESGAQQSSSAANGGIKKAALKEFPTISYSPGLKLPGLDSKCAICLCEFARGVRIRVLPRCHHGFHVKCIDKWLASHSSCPTCRQCLLEVCQKIVGCARDCAPGAPAASQPVVVPLDPEGLIILSGSE